MVFIDDLTVSIEFDSFYCDLKKFLVENLNENGHKLKCFRTMILFFFCSQDMEIIQLEFLSLKKKYFACKVTKIDVAVAATFC